MAFSREVRLGIVMYGGVSLAVYENGVAQEFFRAVKGEGVYKLIKQLTDSDIVVDIMSGTSAGGINGIMLGYALANGRDFTSSAELWRNDGDILKLLRNRSDPDNLSILDSRGFYQTRLEAAYDQMPPYPAEKETAATPSNVQELDVFVTGTDVHGRIFTEFDDDGHPIDVKDHRQVFLLSYREERKNEFDRNQSGTVEALAKLSRITSCFPVAFEPVRLPDPRDNSKADVLLKRWGSLPDDHAAYFLDGGLLDNKPFSYTFNQILHRTTTRPVHRMLFYVEPDPEKFVDTMPSDAPNVMQSALDALVNIPGYQSIASDLQNIASHNDRANSFREILNAAEPSINSEFEAAKQQSDLLREAAGDGGLDLILDAGRKAQYLQCRLSQISLRGMDGILKKNGEKLLLEDRGQRHAAKVLVKSFIYLLNPKVVTSLRNQAGTILLKFDVYFRQRRLFYLADKVQRLAEDQPRKDSVYAPMVVWINHHIKLLEMVQYAMETVADKAPIPWEDLKDSSTENSNAAEKKWSALQNVLAELLDPKGLLPDASGPIPGESLSETAKRLKQTRAEFMEKIVKRIEEVSKKTGSTPPPVVVPDLLLQVLDQQEQEMLALAPDGKDGKAFQQYCKFPIVDSYKFPLEYVSDTETSQTIHTVRISPIDARRAFSNRSLDDKICGNELAHFGGFLKSSWRANDIMWGRLDGVCQLIECLITPERINKMPVAPTLGKVELDKCFPHAAPIELTKLQGVIPQLKDLASNAETQPEGFEAFWELVTRMAQREILQEEVPLVMASAIQQQRTWNQYVFTATDKNSDTQAVNGKSPLSLDPMVWKPGIKQLDEAVTAFAANQMVTNAEPPERWDGFFATSYHVGEENLQSGIPKPVLLEIASQVALRLRESAVAITGKQEKTIRASHPYRLLVEWPINLAYAFFRSQRTAPEWRSQISSGLIVAAVVALTLDILLFPSLSSGHWEDHWEMVLFCTLIPFVLLASLFGFLKWSASSVTIKSDDPLRRFYLRAAFKDRWSNSLENLSAEDGIALFGKLISLLESPGYKLDVEQLRRVNLFDVLRGEKAIPAWAPVAKSSPKRQGFSPIPVAIGSNCNVWHFKIKERTASKIKQMITGRGKPRKLYLSPAKKKEWKDTLKSLRFGEGLELLNAALFMLEAAGFMADMKEQEPKELIAILGGEKDICAWPVNSSEQTTTFPFVSSKPDGWNFVLSDQSKQGYQP